MKVETNKSLTQVEIENEVEALSSSIMKKEIKSVLFENISRASRFGQNKMNADLKNVRL